MRLTVMYGGELWIMSSCLYTICKFVIWDAWKCFLENKIECWICRRLWKIDNHSNDRNRRAKLLDHIVKMTETKRQRTDSTGKNRNDLWCSCTKRITLSLFISRLENNYCRTIAIFILNLKLDTEQDCCLFFSAKLQHMIYTSHSKVI